MSVEDLKNLSAHPYQIVYADPPWDYSKTSWTLTAEGGFRDTAKKVKEGTAKYKYNTMSVEDLKNLSVHPYQIVYADPPWHFKRDIDKSYTSRKTTLNINNQYNTMSPNDIAELPIKDIVHKDAACFMWTTDAHLPYAFEIIKAWGFTYKTIGFVWVKKSTHGKQIKLLAPWTNKGAEICLFGTRGAMTKYLGAKNVCQVHEEIRREHSRKPDIIRDEIVRMFPECRRIELFARTAMPGWDVWGNEVDKFTENQVKDKNTLF